MLAAAGIALVGLAALWSRTPVGPLTGGPLPGDLGLSLPLAYLALAPAYGLLDALSLLTPRQHVAFLAFLAAGWTALRAVRVARGGRRRSRSAVRLALGEGGRFAAFAAAVLGYYVFGVLAPRPMAALATRDPDVVVVDFHSHTERSHDGRDGFDAEANRAWHAAAGFDLAWITDHRHTDSALAGASRNPAQAGAGTSLLAGLELVFEDDHVVVLDTALAAERAPGAPWPAVVQTIPEDLAVVPGHALVAIELVDGDPRALAQSERERVRILRLADSLDLALVASSNLHGWGRTAPAWNLVRVEGWRELPPDEVGRRVVARIGERRSAAIEVVERTRLADPEGQPWRLVLIGPLLAAHLLAVLTWPERLAWSLWILAAAAAATLLRRRAERRLEDALRADDRDPDPEPELVGGGV